VFRKKDFVFCQKHLEQAFFYVFFHSHPFNEMFIVNGKCNCCNDTFTDVRFTSLLEKNISKNTNYFYAVKMNISLAILSEIFIQSGCFFLRVMQ